MRADISHHLGARQDLGVELLLNLVELLLFGRTRQPMPLVVQLQSFNTNLVIIVHLHLEAFSASALETIQKRTGPNSNTVPKQVLVAKRKEQKNTDTRLERMKIALYRAT